VNDMTARPVALRARLREVALPVLGRHAARDLPEL